MISAPITGTSHGPEPKRRLPQLQVRQREPAEIGDVGAQPDQLTAAPTPADTPPVATMTAIPEITSTRGLVVKSPRWRMRSATVSADTIFSKPVFRV